MAQEKPAASLALWLGCWALRGAGKETRKKDGAPPARKRR